MTSRFLVDFLGIQFFGEFLIDRWVINREQLLEALDQQLMRNLRLGDIAVKKGYLSEDQVREINQKQRTTDMAFGELAVRDEYLTQDQLSEMIRFQRNNNIFLGETLLRLGYITDDVLKRELANFREHQARHLEDDLDRDFDPLTSTTIRACVSATTKMFRRVVGLRVKRGRGSVVTAEEQGARQGYHLTVGVTLTGGHSIDYILSTTREIAIAITGSILERPEGQVPDDLLEDGVKEFCNIVCGNAAAVVSRRGIDVDLHPPFRLTELPVDSPGRRTVAFPVRTLSGGVDLRFLVGANEKA